MNTREEKIRMWFDMWQKKTDHGLMDLFSFDAVYIESWGPEYHGANKIKHWFDEWNQRGTVLIWDIKQFIHTNEQTVVQKEKDRSSSAAAGKRSEYIADQYRTEREKFPFV